MGHKQNSAKTFDSYLHSGGFALKGTALITWLVEIWMNLCFD